jgi:hypothetical protein
MARDIEEFLRRAAERRKQAQQGGGQKRPPAQRQPAPLPRQTISERDLVKPGSNFPAAKIPSIGEESVAEHVQRHLDVSDIVEHVDHLAEEIEQADERMDAHLDQVFDHDVGKLGSKKSATDELVANVSSNPIANDLLRMLQNPKTVRQSIMIAEILKRPDFEDEE